MVQDVILLGTHFLFREELGSRLRSQGYTVHPYDNTEDLDRRLGLPDYQVKLAIVDLQHQNSGGIQSVEQIIQQGIPVLVIGEHKKVDILNEARNLGAKKVITNSQASKKIEMYVEDILNK
ncbi:MAG: response regulator [Candidatus Kariarchaeaceae archaeon]|jgi:DNA-binding NtrC family response regulator